MRLTDYIFQPLKNLGRQKARTFLTILAVVVGAVSITVMLSLVFGARSVFLKQIESTGALTQVMVSASTDTSEDSLFNPRGGDSSGTKLTDATATKLSAIPHVKSALPLLQTYQLRKYHLDGASNSKDYDFNQVSAYDPAIGKDRTLTAGRNLKATDQDNVMVLARRAALKLAPEAELANLVGKKLIISTQEGYSGVGSVIATPPPMGQGPGGGGNNKQEMQPPTKMTVEIIGITASGPYEDQSFITMHWAKGLYINQRYEYVPGQNNGKNQPDPGTYKLVSDNSWFEQQGYSGILLEVDGTANVAGVATAVKAMNLGASTAEEMIKSFNDIFKVISAILGAIGGIALFIAALGVINTMVMATLERTREIGILRACGASRATVRRLFTTEAALIGFWGGVFGVGLAYALTKIASIYGGDALAASGVAVTDLVTIPLWLVATVITATTIIGVLAGFYPAIRAARLNPVEALRYE